VTGPAGPPPGFLRRSPLSLLFKIVFYALMLFALQLAFGVFGPQPGE
jgi:hypothetical protein